MTLERFKFVSAPAGGGLSVGLLVIFSLRASLEPEQCAKEKGDEEEQEQEHMVEDDQSRRHFAYVTRLGGFDEKFGFCRVPLRQLSWLNTRKSILE